MNAKEKIKHARWSGRMAKRRVRDGDHLAAFTWARQAARYAREALQ